MAWCVGREWGTAKVSLTPYAQHMNMFSDSCRTHCPVTGELLGHLVTRRTCIGSSQSKLMPSIKLSYARCSWSTTCSVLMITRQANSHQFPPVPYPHSH